MEDKDANETNTSYPDNQQEDNDKKPSSMLNYSKILNNVMFYWKTIRNNPKYKTVFSFTLSIFLMAYIRSRRVKTIQQGESTKSSSVYAIPILSYIFGTSKPLSLESSSPSQHATEEVPLSFLFTAIQNKEIQKAFLNSCTCIFTLRTSNSNNENPLSSSSTRSKGFQNRIHDKDKSWKKVTFPESNELRTKILSQLSETGCDQIKALPITKSISSQMQEALIYAIPFLYLALVYKMLKKFQNDPFADHDSPLSKQINSSSIITFESVAGVESAKLELQEVVQCLSKPNLYKKIGARVPKGVLLYGPPGAGKTLLARAVAGEAGKNCVFIACSGGDFVEVLVGRGAARVRDLFARARREALATVAKHQSNSWLPNIRSTFSLSSSSSSSSSYQTIPPASAVVFIDEIDALAKSRNGIAGGSNFGGGCDEREQTLNQLLTEMDGFYSNVQKNVTIVVFAATNRPDVLDPALLRPGRFDRHVHVGLPDAKGREAILKLHASKIQLEKVGSTNEIKWKELVVDTSMRNFSGADIENVVNEAAFLAVRQHQDLVGHSHLNEATEKIAKMKCSRTYNML